MRLLITLTLMIGISFSTHAKKFNSKKSRVIDVDSHEHDPKKPWLKVYGTESQNIQRLIAILAESPTGKKLLKKAKKKARSEGKTLLSLFKPGEGSLLDTTLVRRFSQSNPDQVYYQSKSTIYLNQYHTTLNAVLDMAHELTHFTFRKPFNPYVGNFTPDKFVKSTVEGLGGEVDAYLVECKVLYELYPTQAASLSSCEKIRDPRTGKFSKRVGVLQFYRVGQRVGKYEKELKDLNLELHQFPHLSSSTASFISSAWGLPYPLAAIMEYKTIMGKVCHNDQKRLVIMQNNVSRSPASLSEREGQRRQYRNLKQKFQNRCQPFI